MRLLQDSGLVKVYLQEKHSQEVRPSVASNTAFTIKVWLPKLSKQRRVPADDSWQSEQQSEHDFYSNTTKQNKIICPKAIISTVNNVRLELVFCNTRGELSESI